jgi:hypothetical protein
MSSKGICLALVYATNKQTAELEREPSCSIVSQLAETVDRVLTLFTDYSLVEGVRKYSVFFTFLIELSFTAETLKIL